MDAWIKMRFGLTTHPKIVRIASALNADRLRVIGALYAAWTLADEHTEDGSLPGYSLTALDESVGLPGIAQAMKDVKWLDHDEKGLSIPRFEEHNGQSAKRRAQEAQRKREARKSSAPDADKKRTRVRERERVKTPIVPLKLPEGISDADWQAFRDHRIALKKRLTPKAEELAAAKLHDLVRQGYDATRILNRAIESGWQTFYAHDDCRAAPASSAAPGNCACGQKGIVRAGGEWRCEAHVRVKAAA